MARYNYACIHCGNVIELPFKMGEAEHMVMAWCDCKGHETFHEKKFTVTPFKFEGGSPSGSTYGKGGGR